MRIEKKEFSAFISHSGLTVFANRTPGGYTLKATERQENGTWRTAGEMRLLPEEIKQYIAYLEELVFS
jgi:hypothetical protein